MFDKEKIIYLAGIIDGEGSICIDIQTKSKEFKRKCDYYAVRLLIVNTNIKLMDWLLTNFKGNVLKRKLIKNHKQCYKWEIFSHNAVNILKECLPYMIVKDELAKNLIEFMETKPKNVWYVTDEIQEKRKILYQKNKTLNS